MKATRITSMNTEQTAVNQKLVTAKDYNNLKDDFDSVISADGSINGEYFATGTLTAAQIVGTAAGQLGHANGVTLVAAPGANYTLEFLGAVIVYNRAVASYTGGGNDTVIQLGTAATTGVISSANFLGAAADAYVALHPLAAAANVLTSNSALSLKSTTAWTQPGTAAGVIKYRITYKVHPVI